MQRYKRKVTNKSGPCTTFATLCLQMMHHPFEGSYAFLNAKEQSAQAP
eukprot:CAMPEP_0183555312 /NCGR_PEP_ID=MMETSP0371-20130417/79413_1 /TAXON_ID=268820 /ORGANISM="Peridinium aciculiferum, Strain PAER-2" /LENGTH=47 /DNA_ID= /DNA_START= /DNA_END= /DNA_ORIENTATION=